MVSQAETLVADFQAIDAALVRLQSDLELRIQSELENLNGIGTACLMLNQISSSLDKKPVAI